MLNDSIYLNPSYGSLLPTYSISANYQYFNGQQQPDGSNLIHGHVTNFSVQDGQSPLFEAGVGLSLKDYGKMLNIGASKSVIRKLGIGLGAKFFFPNASNQATSRDMIFSTTYVVLPWLQAAFIVDNLFSTPAAREQGLYREFILGTKVNIKGIMMIYFDPHLAPDVPNQSSFGHETGVEFAVFKDFFLRLGMFKNANVPYLENVRGRGYAFGFGWLGPKISIDYALSHLVEPASTVNQNFGMTIYF